jgi:excisionase family DNA binding protein
LYDRRFIKGGLKVEKLERRTLTVPEAAKIIGVCNKTAYQMVTAGKLPVIRVSMRKVVIPKEALEQWLKDSVTWPETKGESA